jgi:hypothetical protein
VETNLEETNGENMIELQEVDLFEMEEDWFG